MKNILEEIAAYKRAEIENLKKIVSDSQIHTEVELMLTERVPSLKCSIMESSTGIIAEFKRRSPSKGWLNKDCSVADTVLSYQHNGASAVSILTDRHFFCGEDSYICEAVSGGLTIPVLYKNFILDEYQLFQARKSGASAVLLIAALLDRLSCGSFVSVAHELGMEAILELHDESELDYIEINPDICGVNNRNLFTFVTDVDCSFLLSEKLPADICKISESGISDPRILLDLKKCGYNGFLIGESFMRSKEPGMELKKFIENLDLCKI